jgi:hypothetical protein
MHKFKKVTMEDDIVKYITEDSKKGVISDVSVRDIDEMFTEWWNSSDSPGKHYLDVEIPYEDYSKVFYNVLLPMCAHFFAAGYAKRQLEEKEQSSGNVEADFSEE